LLGVHYPQQSSREWNRFGAEWRCCVASRADLVSKALGAPEGKWKRFSLCLAGVEVNVPQCDEANTKVTKETEEVTKFRDLDFSFVTFVFALPG